MAENGEKYKRSQILVNKDFQFTYISKILLLEVISVAATALVMSFLFLFVFNNDTLVSSGPWGKGIMWSTILLIFILMGLLFWLGMHFSHRIAGPMYRFEKAFNDIHAGKLSTRIYLREKDEMKPVATEFNQMMDFLTKKIPENQPLHAPNNADAKITQLIKLTAESDLSAAEKDKYRKVLEGLIGKL